jgi:hypothetical protein
MLHSSRVSLSLWAEATQPAHVLNLIPNKSLNYKTPTEQLTGTNGRIDHLRVFGSDVYVLKQGHQRKKLDAKAEKGILVGYSSNNNAYRVFMGGKQIVIAKDVIIRERVISQTTLDHMKTEAVSVTQKEPMTSHEENSRDEFVVDVFLPITAEDTIPRNQSSFSSVGAVQTEETLNCFTEDASLSPHNFPSGTEGISYSTLSQPRNCEFRAETALSEDETHETGLECEATSENAQDVAQEVLHEEINEGPNASEENANTIDNRVMTRSMTLKKKRLESNL